MRFVQCLDFWYCRYYLNVQIKNYYYHLVDFTVKRKILEENLPNDSNCYLFEHLNNIYLSVKLIFMVFIEILLLWGKNSFNSKLQYQTKSVVTEHFSK